MAEVLDGLEAAVERLQSDVARLEAKLDATFVASEGRATQLESKLSTGFSLPYAEIVLRALDVPLLPAGMVIVDE